MRRISVIRLLEEKTLMALQVPCPVWQACADAGEVAPVGRLAAHAAYVILQNGRNGAGPTPAKTVTHRSGKSAGPVCVCKRGALACIDLTRPTPSYAVHPDSK